MSIPTPSNPKPKSLAEIKADLLQPALTSHFAVEITPPESLVQNFAGNGVSWTLSQSKLNLLCSETVLPGSSIGTLELNNDYHGTTVRHAYRRLYDDRIDLTFYVSADDYLPIRFFETWIKYIVGENISSTSESNTKNSTRPGSTSSNYFYRVNYPDYYISKDGLMLTKFERTSSSGSSYSGRTLQYLFKDVFPISISSMPVSYDSSSLLKCSVSLSYIRYIMIPASAKDPAHADAETSQSNDLLTSFAITPEQAAELNKQALDPNIWNTNLGLNYGNINTTGGVNFSTAAASGNTISSFIV